MFELTEADVFRLVEMFASSDATFMQVRVDDVELVLSRNSQDGVRTDPDVGVASPGTGSSAGAVAGTVARRPETTVAPARAYRHRRAWLPGRSARSAYRAWNTLTRSLPCPSSSGFSASPWS